MKSASQYLDHIHWYLARKLCSKKSLLLTCEIFGLHVNTLATDEKYLVLNLDRLPIPVQMILFENQKVFLNFLLYFWSLAEILNVLKKKMVLIAFVFPKLRTPKTWLDKCLKGPASGDPSTSKMVNVPKHYWDLHHISFVMFIYQCRVNWVGKNLSYWHTKSWDCFLTHWLQMKIIPFFIETI